MSLFLSHNSSLLMIVRQKKNFTVDLNIIRLKLIIWVSTLFVISQFKSK
ncbi:hypothetical protein SAMN05216353_10323 [Halobacillus alkaliphilus]|uniref:Uncharacterized protein n=1 Tax=Halobacillus alkaliphilus TaxID=396056 RepID=A0A1I2K122_9BACI|nr:hypothetical protein SAMN05216353_10323 [Halobacillus alkaliphilus]